MAQPANKSYSAAHYKAAQEMFRKPCRFMRGVKRMEDLQQLAMAEVAFSGRSNVGKSSLLNALIGQKSMARTSKTPGRTQELNFFSLGDRVILVDMPGYGYANVPESERRSWDKFFPEYLSTRDRLMRVFVLIDARHGIKENDRQMMNLLETASVPYQVVFTKIDEIYPSDQDSLSQSIMVDADRQECMVTPPLFVSSHEKTGIAELQAQIFDLVQQS